MGGDDCGFPFVTGQEYLVYAHGSPVRYSTGVCSRTRQLSAASEDLAYLRRRLTAAAGRISAPLHISARPATCREGGRRLYGHTRASGSAVEDTTGRTAPTSFAACLPESYAVALTVAATEEVSGPATIELATPRACEPRTSR